MITRAYKSNGTVKAFIMRICGSDCEYTFEVDLFSLLQKLRQLIEIGTDLQFCTFRRVTIAFFIVVIENQ